MKTIALTLVPILLLNLAFFGLYALRYRNIHESLLNSEERDSIYLTEEEVFAERNDAKLDDAYEIKTENKKWFVQELEQCDAYRIGEDVEVHIIYDRYSPLLMIFRRVDGRRDLLLSERIPSFLSFEDVSSFFQSSDDEVFFALNTYSGTLGIQMLYKSYYRVKGSEAKKELMLMNYEIYNRENHLILLAAYNNKGIAGLRDPAITFAQLSILDGKEKYEGYVDYTWNGKNFIMNDENSYLGEYGF
jgi:hypothetical protein